MYLIKIEAIREHILSDLYGILPCTVPPIDTVTDVAFEYSLLANILLVTMHYRMQPFYHQQYLCLQVVACVGCTRWLLLPWLVMYLVNILLLLCLALVIFIIPVQEDMEHSAEYQAINEFGFATLVLAAALAYAW